MKYGYARVSPGGKSESVEAQARQLTKAGCKKVFRDMHVSGAKTDRAQLRRLLDQLDAGDVLMVTRLDRLARSTRDLSITCRRSGPVTTYYPIPFSRPPHLTIDLTRGSCEWITEQQPEGFTIKFGSSSYSTSSPPVLTWTAKGLPIKSHSDQG
jgi:hypothetical protein